MTINSLLTSSLRYNRHISLLSVLLFTFLILLLFPKGESIESEVTVGSVWIHDDLIASTTFEILKDSKVLDKERNQAADTVFPVFLRDTSITGIMIDSLRRYNIILNKNLNQENNNTFLSNESFRVFVQAKKQGNNKLLLSSLFKFSETTLKEIYQRGAFNSSQVELKKDSIALRSGKYERLLAVNSLLNMKDAGNFIGYRLKSLTGSNTPLVEAVEEYLLQFVSPNIIFSRTLTDAAIQNAKDKIPRNVGIINENERVVAKHDRITPEIKLKIDSYRIAKGEERGLVSKIFQLFGKMLHLILIILPFIIYLSLFRKKIYTDNLLILLIGCVVLFIASLTFLTNILNIAAPVEYLILIPVVSMLLTIIFDSRIGFYATIIVSLIAGALRGNDYVFAVTNIVTGAIAAYTVRDVKNRTQIFRSFLYILIGYALCIVAFGLERFESITDMTSALAFAASNALISPVLTYGLIIFVERIFKLTTDLTLLELTDLNSPLLKELAKNAPGTFSHSVAMGTLAETTAEAIGANPVLAKVGAYYHDVGKTFHPEGFAENQIDNHNIHENISPEESADLIREHVQKGIELAKKNKLPKEVLDFIPMHHGTMVISYFFEKAKSLYGESNVDIDEFRYPGPKPNSKETAVVMLADSCESAIRSLSDADSQIIENVINNLINNRIEDGQLDDAPLTFSDIKKIKESFLTILVGHQHRRIRYPKQDELEAKSED
jgi:cyclic-di-AMP phosphodiesterase PgpH